MADQVKSEDIITWLKANAFDFAVADFQKHSITADELLQLNTLNELEEITVSGRTTQRKMLLSAILKTYTSSNKASVENIPSISNPINNNGETKSASKPIHKCEVCQATSREGNKNLLRCSRCQSVRYCSKSHQRQDWIQKHKQNCSKTSKVKQEVVKSTNVNDRNDQGETALHSACDANLVNVVKVLLTIPEIDVNLTHENGDAPLHCVCSQGHRELVKILLNSANININLTNKNLLTPLNIASDAGEVEVVEILLACSGIDLEAVDKWGDSPIVSAYKNGHHAIVDILREAGADADAIDVQLEEKNQENSSKDNSSEDNEEYESEDSEENHDETPVPEIVSSKARICTSIFSSGAANMNTTLENFEKIIQAGSNKTHLEERKRNEKLCSILDACSENKAVAPWIDMLFADGVSGIRSLENKQFYDFRLSRKAPTDINTLQIKQLTALYNSMHELATMALHDLEDFSQLPNGTLTRYIEPCGQNFYDESWSATSTSKSYLSIHRYTRNEENLTHLSCEEHVDRGLLTFIVAPSASGFQLQRVSSDGEISWVDLDNVPEASTGLAQMIMCGATLRRATSGDIPAAIHRVKLPKGMHQRTSIVFKLHAPWNQRFVCLPKININRILMPCMVKSSEVQIDHDVEKQRRVRSIGIVGESVGDFLATFDKTHVSVNYEQGTRYNNTDNNNDKEGEQKHSDGIQLHGETQLDEVCQYVWHLITDLSSKNVETACSCSYLFDFPTSNMCSLKISCCISLVKQLIENGPNNSILWGVGGGLDFATQDIINIAYLAKFQRLPVIYLIVGQLFGKSNYEVSVPNILNFSVQPGTRSALRLPCYLSDSAFKLVLTTKMSQLENIDLSGQTSLTTASLEHLSATCPKLKVLNLSKLNLDWWSPKINFSTLETLHFNSISERTMRILNNGEDSLYFPSLKVLTFNNLDSRPWPGWTSPYSYLTLKLEKIAPKLEVLDLRKSSIHNLLNIAPPGLRTLLTKGCYIEEEVMYRIHELRSVKNWNRLQHLQLLDRVFVPFSILREIAPNLTTLEMTLPKHLAGDLVINHPMLQKLVLFIEGDTTRYENIFATLVKGAPNLNRLELRKCRLRLTKHSFDQLASLHQTLEVLKIGQSFHLYDSRTYNSAEMLPAPTYNEDDSSDLDFEILLTDLKYLESDVPSCYLTVKDQSGDQTYFKIKYSTHMSKVFRAYAVRKGCSEQSLRFLLDGERIGADETPFSLELNMTHGKGNMSEIPGYVPDQIDCVLQQCGD